MILVGRTPGGRDAQEALRSHYPCGRATCGWYCGGRRIRRGIRHLANDSRNLSARVDYFDGVELHVRRLRRLDLASLSHVFETARKEWGVHVDNPLKDIKMPSENPPRDR